MNIDEIMRVVDDGCVVVGRIDKLPIEKFIVWIIELIVSELFNIQPVWVVQ